MNVRCKTSKGRIDHGANRLGCEPISVWANRPGGESTMGRTVQGANQTMGRIVQRANRLAFGRNVHGAKRTMGETSCYRFKIRKHEYVLYHAWYHVSSLNNWEHNYSFCTTLLTSQSVKYADMRRAKHARLIQNHSYCVIINTWNTIIQCIWKYEINSKYIKSYFCTICSF